MSAQHLVPKFLLSSFFILTLYTSPAQSQADDVVWRTGSGTPAGVQQLHPSGCPCDRMTAVSTRPMRSSVSTGVCSVGGACFTTGTFSSTGLPRYIRPTRSYPGVANISGAARNVIAPIGGMTTATTSFRYGVPLRSSRDVMQPLVPHRIVLSVPAAKLSPAKPDLTARPVETATPPGRKDVPQQAAAESTTSQDAAPDAVTARPNAPNAKKKSRKKGDPKTPARQSAGRKKHDIPLLVWNISKQNETARDEYARSSEIVVHGGVRINPQDELNLRDGWVLFPDSSRPLTEKLRHSNAFLLLMNVTCRNGRKQPVPIFRVAKDDEHANFMLGQKGKRFVVRVRSGEKDEDGREHETRFGRILPGAWQQVAVSYDGRRLECFVDGERVINKEVELDFSSWQRYPVSIGSDAAAGHRWSGTVHSLIVLPTADPESLDRFLRTDGR